MQKQIKFKEYTVTIADSGSVEVFKTYRNPLEGLREFADKIKFKYDPSWGEFKLCTALLNEVNGTKGKSVAITKEFIINREDNGVIKISKIFSNTTGALRELSASVGFEYDPKWGPRTFGAKVIDAVEDGTFAKLFKLKKDAEKAPEEEVAEAKTVDVAAPIKPKIFTAEDYEEMGCPDDLQIPDGYTEIAGEACAETEIQRVIIPNTVTKIGAGAFCDCSWLCEVHIPNSVIDVNGNVFGFADGINERSFRNRNYVWDEELVEDDGILYNKDPKDESILIPIALVDGYDCIDISEGVQKLNRILNSVEFLTEITLPNSLTEIGANEFDGCYELEYISIGTDEDEEYKLKKIGCGAFYGTKVSNLWIPDSVTEIENDAFDGCNALSEITLPKMFKDKLKQIGIDPDNVEVRFH